VLQLLLQQLLQVRYCAQVLSWPAAPQLQQQLQQTQRLRLLQAQRLQ
jgi:hypothetical protein